MVRNLLSFYNGCTDSEVVDTSVVAGAKECLVNADTANLFCRHNIIHEVRTCCNRLDFGKVKGILSCVNRIGIALENSLRLTASCL